MSDEIVEYGKPVFDLHKFSSTPIKIASIELLKAGNVYLLRTRSTDGAEGIIQCKDIADYIPILAHRVMPHFLNQDARDLEHLVDEVYVDEFELQAGGAGVLVSGGVYRAEPVRSDGEDAGRSRRWI